MKILATLMAVLAVLCLSSGAMAGDVFKIELPLSFTAIDTTDFVQSNLINDTIYWSSPEFGVNQDFDHIIGRILLDTADTHTATATVYDSMYFVIQTKMEEDMDSTWYTMWTSSLMPLASFDSLNGWARGAASAFSIPADSMPNIGNLFRVNYYLICEEDSMRSAYTLNIIGTTTAFDLPHSMEAYFLFKSGGYNLGLDGADGIDEVRDTLSLIEFQQTQIRDTLSLIEFQQTQIRDTLEAIKSDWLTTTFYDTNHAVGETSTSMSKIGVTGYRYFWFSVEWAAGADTADNNDQIWVLQTNTADALSRWRYAYVAASVGSDSANYPVQFAFDAADSLIFDSLQVVMLSDEGADGNTNDSTNVGVSPIFNVRMIARKY